jgi:RND family efflux transporter MFP subunit
MKRLLLPIVAILILTASCTEKVKPGAVEVKREVVTGVTLVKVLRSHADSYYETSGTVVAKTTSVIGARTMGTVISMKVREGDRVGQGQELVALDDQDLAQKVVAAEYGHKEAQKALQEAEQNRRLASITYDRYKNLFDDKVISQQEMDQVETQRKVADLGYERAQEAANRVRAQLEEARIYRGFTRIVAPHAGLITTKKTEQGSLAAPGSPLLVLEDTSRYTVEAPVDQRMANLMKIGASVVILLPPDGRKVPGRVSEIMPAIDPGTRSFLVKIGLTDPSLRSGLYVRVLVPEGRKQTFLIPKTAIIEKGQLAGVYVVDDRGVMTYRMVRTGRSYGDRVEMLSGLRDGETIAVTGLEKAVDGGVVKESKSGGTDG